MRRHPAHILHVTNGSSLNAGRSPATTATLWLMAEHRQRARVITVLNLKGGVGKTHTSWLLASVAQERRERILLIDLDTQANLTRSFLDQVDPLGSVGYPPRLVSEWADITLAAKERFGEQFFRRSSQAFFLDNLKHARTGRRQPPDWWRELNKSEQREHDQAVWQSISTLFPAPVVVPKSKTANAGGLQRIGALVGPTKTST